MDQRIESVLDFIEDNLGSPLNLKRLAEVACLSPSRFHRLFRKETGDTPFRFIEKLKINKAYQLILEENAQVTDLAIKLGYNDYETFSRAFKKYFYMAPDDLKSIAQEIRTHYKADERVEIMFITAEEDSTEQEIRDKFHQMVQERGFHKILQAKGLSIQDLPVSVGYRIQRVIDSDGRGASVKNKYKIVRDKKIWSSLIKQTSSE